MKTINKILATLLILVMVLSLVPMTFAAEADYTAASGETVEIGIDIGKNYSFEMHWKNITYSNSNIISSVSGDDSNMHIDGAVNDECAFYYTGRRPTVSSTFVIKLTVTGNVGDTCEITIPYLVCEDGIYDTSYTKTVTVEIVAPHTHSYVWKHDANQHWKECDCGDKISVGSHSWEWVIDTPAGEFSSGSKHEECKTCGRTRNEGTPIDPTHEHNYGESYKHDANQHWKECAGCPEKIAVGNHTWEWVVDTPAGEHTSGVQHEECSVCHRTRNEGTPIDPTHECVFGGWRYDEDKHWKECSCKLHAEEGAHTYGDWTITKYPSATKPGAKERKCSVCGYKDTAKIDPTGEPDDPDPSTGPSTEPTVPGTEPTTPGTEPTVPGTEPESTPATEPSAPTQPIKPGTQEPEEGCCWWCILILILILILIGVVLWYFLIYKKRKKGNGKKA